MYENIGKKIKGLASFISYGGMFFSIAVGLFASVIMENFLTIIIAAVFAVIFWFSGIFAYGFGELIEQTTQINEKTKGNSDTKNSEEK